MLKRSRGFTLIELVVAITVVVLLAMLGAPSFSEWIQNARVRSAAESLQSALKLAQAEATRRSRGVVFSFTAGAPMAAAVKAAAGGRYWSMQTIPAVAGEGAEALGGGSLDEAAPGVAVTGPAVLCFNAMGRLFAADAPGTGIACALDASQPGASFGLSRAGATRPLRVLVSLGGQIRTCDPARSGTSLSDGCPAGS